MTDEPLPIIHPPFSALRGREPLTAVGRSGELHLDYARQGPKTVITKTRCTSPWHFVPPIYLDESGSAYTLLVNPSGGLVGGDRLAVRMALGAESHVLVSAPSANRVYRSVSETSAQIVDITVGPRAILEWLPEPTIPFAGSRFRQEIGVKLEPGATLLLWDAIAAGRIARGERWKFTTLENEIKITLSTGNRVVERYALAPEGEWAGAGLARPGLFRRDAGEDLLPECGSFFPFDRPNAAGRLNRRRAMPARPRG